MNQEIIKAYKLLLTLLLELLKLLSLKQRIVLENKRKRRWWRRPINRDRLAFGYFFTTFQRLKQDPEIFFRVTRMNLELFNNLCAYLQIDLLKYRSDISPEERLAITLRFLATGDSILSIALEYKLGETTVYNIIINTCEIIFKKLSPTYLTIPSEEEWIKIKVGFWDKWQMPNCIGAIDGKHVQIKCPPNSGSVYFNYKKTYSLVLLAVCNHNYEFTLFDVGAVGSESDGGIFARSNLGKALKEKQLNIPQGTRTLPRSSDQTPLYFVGDEAFQLSPCLMRPYPGHNLDQKKLIFNYRLSRARRIIENCFGILVNRWLFLSKAIGFNPDSTIKCVLAAICLHNFLLKFKYNDYVENLVDSEENQTIQNIETVQNDINVVNSINNIDFQISVQNANCIRNTLSNYFVTTEGEVAWQYDHIARGSL